ncbi:MAG TPA: hypothetical protein VG097_07040 [Gemmata sp.]|jgi:hypothetical protein|nr:hypothetical protein [Gemmata sp.]
MRKCLDTCVDGKMEYTMLRPLAIAAIACGALVFVLAAGCSSRAPKEPPTGGAQGSKAERARKQAEGLALNVVNGAAKSQAKAIPSLTRREKGGVGGLFNNISPQDIAQIKSGTSPHVPSTPAKPEPVSAPAFPSPPPQIIAAIDPLEPKSPPRPGSPAVIRERIASSAPYQSEAEAEADVLNVAQYTIERSMAELDPPVKYRPSINEIKSEFIRKDSRATRQPNEKQMEDYAKNGISSKWYSVEYDIEVTADQIRELRTRDRITNAFRVIAGLTFLALSCFLFLRADEWTKGYLTRWLACGVAALVVGAAVALFLV